MQLGIFARTFTRATVGEVFKAVKRYVLECVQFNFSCAGLPTLPDALAPALVERIRGELKRNSLVMAAVSGTSNLIHPDAATRSKNLARLCELIRSCPGLGSPIVTLCTGTRDPHDMWRAHPDNELRDAWRDLIRSLELLLPVAQEAGVVLGIEPEPANVINSAAQARKLLDELRSPFLKIIFDAANLLEPATLSKQSEILADAMDRLGPDIVLAHAKDLGREGHVSAGQGGLDYALYISLLQTAGFNGPLILHNLSEAEVPAAVGFLQTHLGPGHAVSQSREH